MAISIIRQSRYLETRLLECSGNVISKLNKGKEGIVSLFCGLGR